MSTDAEIFERSLITPNAFGELFERHGPPLGRYATRRVGETAASDVVAETFLIAFKKRARFDPARGDALPWLFGIATRVLAKHLHDERNLLRAVQASPLDHIAPDDLELASNRLDATRHVTALSKALMDLPKRDRDALLLHAWGDLSYDAIAEATGANVGTVKSRIHRARQRLRIAAESTKTQPSAGPEGALSWTN